MARWKFLMLAGFLGWPAVSYAQMPPGGGYGQPYPPPGAMPPSMMTGAPSMLPPGVPPLPGRIGQTGQPTLPQPTPAGQRMAPPSMPGMPGGPGVNMPDVTGMPQGEMGVMPSSFPPGTMPPVPPAPCYSPAPEPEGGGYGGASGLFFQGEALYLRPRRMDPVALLTTQVDATSTVAQLFNYDTNYHIAYRLGGGYLDKSGWIFHGEYTRFKDTVASQVFINDTTNSTLQYVGPGVLGTLIALQPGVLTAQWNLNYQTLDIMGGAVFSPSPVLDIILTGGGRYANIDQRYVIVGDETPFGGGNRSVEDLESTLRGAGPRAGGEARLTLPGGWTAYGRGFTSILLASRDEHSVVQQPGSVQFVNYTRNELLPTLEMAVGIEIPVMENLLIGCGYEWSYFFELGSTNVEFAGNARLNRHVDLGMEGASIRVSFLW